MKHILKEKLFESLRSVLPLTGVVVLINLILYFVFGESIPLGIMVRFLIGALFLFLGLFFLGLGEDLALIYMGRRIGSHLASSGKYVLLIVCALLLGTLITVAEPNLAVFSELIPSFDGKKIILAVSVGVGFFLAVSVIRVIKKLPLPLTLVVIYGAVLAVAFFARDTVLAIAFDAGGVVTGPITASFIMAVGLGLARVRGGRSAVDDSFGAVALCTVGPTVSLLILGHFHHPDSIILEPLHMSSALDSGVIMDYLKELPVIIEEVALVLLPIIIFFTVFQFIFLRFKKQRLLRTGLGVVFAFLGHTFFLTGVYVGFLPTGSYLGVLVASLPGKLSYLVLPVGMLLGGLIVHAEPAVHVLIEQVEEVTVGAVTKRAMFTTMIIGVVIAIGLSMLRILFEIPIWYFLLGGYTVSLILSFIVPRMFTAVAFDSGGVAAGAMTVAFLLPFARGAGSVLLDGGEEVLMHSFGLVAIVVLLPIIMIQLLGLLYKIMLNKASPVKRAGEGRVTIIEFDTEK